METPEDKLIQRIKELRKEYEENDLMTELILEYLVKKYVEEEYRK
ncbi:hypothetical protein QAC11_01110 [Staphylococcus aureus]|nr:MULTISPECIES: hypothetical protein [Staphylococcus]MCS5222604.1 hypothetical protein [Staphylococcus aureus]MCS5335668.1 hypothetical protein [Staphylococcus aureus]MCS5341968.1 hypothetical protein [Staphylococcus aureus]MCS5352419.1 hypothetical protein [Staphylococcus aureus]MDA2857111.1 hypothetical protein [Staphylococcus aureus]